MARSWIRFGIVTIGLGSSLVSALFIAVGVGMLEGPRQHVGVHLEFGAEQERTDESLIAGVTESLPRLLESTGARRVKVTKIDPSTLAVMFDPAQPWSEVHGRRADGAENAPLLLPESLLTLLNTTGDVRVLELETTRFANPVDRDRTLRMLDQHPERALDVLHTALHDAPAGGFAVAWLPHADGKRGLMPLRVEGDHARRITALELANAKRTSGSADMLLYMTAPTWAEHASYISGLNGRRVAFVVDGAIAWLGEARTGTDRQLALVGDLDATTSEACAAIVAHVHRPLLPLKPRITRSWIEPNHAVGGGVMLLVLGSMAGMFALGMLWAFVREMRRPPVRSLEMDWSSQS